MLSALQMDTHRSVLFRDAGEIEYLFMSCQQNARQPHRSFKSVQNETRDLAASSVYGGPCLQADGEVL